MQSAVTVQGVALHERPPVVLLDPPVVEVDPPVVPLWPDEQAVQTRIVKESARMGALLLSGPRPDAIPAAPRCFTLRELSADLLPLPVHEERDQRGQEHEAGEEDPALFFDDAGEDDGEGDAEGDAQAHGGLALAAGLGFGEHA